MAVWPEAQQRPSTVVELGRTFAVLLGWGDGAAVELSEEPQAGTAGPDGPTWLTITSPDGNEVRALAVPTSSGWAFFQIGLEGVGRSAATSTETTLVSAPPPAGATRVRWWAMTPTGEQSGSVVSGTPIVVHAGIESVGSALLVFVDDQGRTISARGSANDPQSGAARQPDATSTSPSLVISTIDAPRQFAYRRAILEPPGSEAIEALPADAILPELQRSAPDASVEMSLGRYTDLDYAALQPSGGTAGLLLTDRLAWVVIEKDVMIASAGPPDAPSVTQRSDVVHVIDARTGQELLTSDGPAGAYCPIEPGATPDRCATE